MYNAFMRPCTHIGSTTPSSCWGDNWVLFQTRIAFTTLNLTTPPSGLHKPPPPKPLWENFKQRTMPNQQPIRHKENSNQGHEILGGQARWKAHHTSIINQPRHKSKTGDGNQNPEAPSP